MNIEDNVAEKAAVAVAKEQENKQGEQDGVVVLQSGIRVRFHPVPPYTVSAVTSKISDPPIPKVPHPNDSTKMIENPASPTYLREKAEAQQKRIDAGLDAMILFGLEVLDPMPEDEGWLDNLVFLGLVDSKDGLDDTTKKLYYRKYVVLDTETIKQLQKMAGITEEMIATAMSNFPNDASEPSDTGART